MHGNPDPLADEAMRPARAGRLPQLLPRLFILGLLAVLGLGLAAWLPAYLAMPLARDQGIFAWVGQTILAGGLPYADAWEVKGPGAHALYALAIAAFGPGEAAIRRFDLLLTGLACLAILRCRLRSLGPVWPAATCILLLTVYPGEYWNSAQPDGWAGLALLVMALLLLRQSGRGSMAGALGAGLLLGLCVVVKPLFGLFALLPLLGFAWLAAPIGRRLALLGGCAAASALPPGLCLGLYAARGELHSLVDVLVTFDLLSHYAGQQRGFGLWALFWSLDGRPRRILPILAVLGAWGLRRVDRRAAALLGAGWALGFLIVAVQNKGYDYHYLPMYAFAAALAAAALAAAWEAGAGLFRRQAPIGDRLAIAATAVLMLFLAKDTLTPRLALAAIWWADPREDAASLPYRLIPDCPAENPPDWLDFCNRDAAVTAALVRRLTAPGTPIFVWGFDALVYFLADRPAASRFGYDYPIVAGAADYARRAEAELRADLERARPAVIVVAEHDANNLMPRSSRAYLAGIGWLQELLDTRYELRRRSPYFSVYLRRQAGPS